MSLPANSSISNVERDVMLWEGMKDGDEFAFRQLFDAYSNVMFQYGITITTERELVKDCIQDLFVTIWTNRQTIGVARCVKYYMLFSLRRLILKKLGATRRFFSLSAFAHLASHHDTNVHSIFRGETLAYRSSVLNSAIHELPSRQKEIIFLKFYQELKNEEIEKIMNLNNQVVRNTLCKALNNLRRKIGTNHRILMRVDEC